MKESQYITSVHNPLVKRLCLLHERKGREEAGSFLVEGVHLVEEALLSGAAVVSVIFDGEKGIDPVCSRALERRGGEGIHLIAASPAVMAKLSDTKSPQGIVAEVKKPQRDWNETLRQLSSRDFLVLMLDGIQDPGNLGTILRTAEAAGADAVIIGKGTVDLYNGKVVRSTMGALFRLPVFSCPLLEAAAQLQSLGGELYVTSLGEGTERYDRLPYDGKIAIVIGNEARGVSREMLAAANRRVHIPLYGQAESLNAAVAAGIMLYEAQRQRKR
jgi:TrmH family RNA methyltransferase